MHQATRPRGLACLAAAVLVILVCAVFRPISDCRFVDYDVGLQLLENPRVHGLSAENIRYIFTSRCVTSYYPIRSLTYAVNYQLWGLNAGVFKLTNGAIHLGNVLLVFWLVLRLFRHPPSAAESPRSIWDICVATFSAGVFAVHPVVVEPVVWVPGREELLMTLGALVCLHFHISARYLAQRGEKIRWVALGHLAAAFSCAAACLSNAVGAVIPLFVLAWDVLMLDRPRLLKICSATAALWLIAAATIVIKQTNDDGDPSGLPAAFSIGPLMVMGQVYWLNLKTLVWPTGLALHYDWPLSKEAMLPGVVLGWTAICLTVAGIWALRRRKLFLFGLLWFCIGLAPTSHVIPHVVLRADRHLYLPLAGVAVAMAIGLRTLKNWMPERLTTVRAIAAAVAGIEILVILGGLSNAQIRTWQTRISLWEHCLQLQPDSAKAHDALADALLDAGQVRPAIEHYWKSLESDPRNFDAVTNIALQLTTGDHEIRDYQTAVPLVEDYCERTGWSNAGLLHALAVCYTSLALDLEKRGDFYRALEFYQKALAVDPEYDKCLLAMAVLLSTCQREDLRRPEEAIELAERACRVTKQPTPDAFMILASACAAADQPDLAVSAIKRAIQLARADDDVNLVRELQENLIQFRDPMRSQLKP